jgi:hypothetical protein
MADEELCQVLSCLQASNPITEMESLASLGMRVDAAIHRMALGKNDKAAGVMARPALLTMNRENMVASDMAGRS